MLKFTKVKRNTFINLGRMQITPRMINGSYKVLLEILAKGNN